MRVLVVEVRFPRVPEATIRRPTLYDQTQDAQPMSVAVRSG
jgi:hypothetical protein